MAASDNVNAAWTEVDTATNELAARVQKLIDEINKTATEGLNGPQTENVLLKLAALKATLTGMGKNPNDPVPAPLPDPAPMPGPQA